MAEKQHEGSPEFNYHLLRNALNGFSKNLSQLDPMEYRQAYHKATKSFDLESLVLASPEAEGLIISEQQLDRSVAEVASRYESAEGFTQDMEANGLDEMGLRQALYRELMFDSVMQKVASRSAEVSDLDARLFYEMHHDRFAAPEQRVARHILITVNPDYPENEYIAARARMEQVLEKLAGRANRFENFARRYSECPTAMEGGKLGDVRRGQLYTELDAMLFSMEENRISPIVETEIGLHILLCEKIKPAKRVSFSKAAPRVHEVLRERQRRNCQKAWLANLQKISHA
ncbi:MAG: nitrogen fixation protein NifM [Candidatus Thiodiazotropha sp.]